MKNKYDAIIIGSGLAGLSCAAKLVKEGKKTAIIEKEPNAGGFAGYFQRKHYIFDIGMHLINGIGNPDDPYAEIYKDLGFADHLEFLELDETYTYLKDKNNIKVSQGFEVIKKELSIKFPDEEKNINAFFTLLYKIWNETASIPRNRRGLFKEMLLVPFRYPNTIKYMKKTLGEVLNQFFQDHELKLLIGANIGYYHFDFNSYSFVHFCAGNGSLIQNGSYYVKGGAKQLIDYLKTLISSGGGEFFFNTEAKKIHIDRRLAKEVICENGAKKKSFFAPIIVNNANYPETVKILPEKFHKRFKKYKNYQYGPSIFNIYLGFKKPLMETGNKYYSRFFFPEEIKTISDFSAANINHDFSKKPAALVDYSLVDESQINGNCPTASLCVIDHAEHWENLPRKAYNLKKEKVSEILINRVEKHLPGFKENIDLSITATPLTMKRYTNNPGGSVYGYSMIPKQFGLNRPKNQTPVKGYFTTSAWTQPSGGISPTIIGGYNTAVKILKSKIT